MLQNLLKKAAGIAAANPGARTGKAAATGLGVLSGGVYSGASNGDVCVGSGTEN